MERNLGTWDELEELCRVLTDMSCCRWYVAPGDRWTDREIRAYHMNGDRAYYTGSPRACKGWLLLQIRRRRNVFELVG